MAAFVAVAEEGSISEAARRLRLAKSVVSERLADLERLLGASLLPRTTRKLPLTGGGELFLARAQRILRDTAAAKAAKSPNAGLALRSASVRCADRLWHFAPGSHAYCLRGGITRHRARCRSRRQVRRCGGSLQPPITGATIECRRPECGTRQVIDKISDPHSICRTSSMIDSARLCR
jgi:hypothetical protein